MAEEEEENQIENDVHSNSANNRDHKKYVRLFSDLSGKKNEPLIDTRLVDENIKAGINKAYQMNLSDIILVAPIAASCQDSFQAFFEGQYFEDLDADQNQSHNSLFLESDFSHHQDQE